MADFLFQIVQFFDNNLKSLMILTEYLRLLIITLLNYNVLSYFTKIGKLEVLSKIIGVGFDQDIIVIASQNQKIYIYQNLTFLATVQCLSYKPSQVGTIKVRKNNDQIEIVLKNNMEGSSNSFQYMVFNLTQKIIVNNYQFAQLNFISLIFQIGKQQVLIVNDKWQVYTINTTTHLVSSNRRSRKAISSVKYDKTRNLYYLGSKEGVITSYSPRESYNQHLIKFWNFESYPILQIISSTRQNFSDIGRAVINFDKTDPPNGYGFGHNIFVNDSNKLAFSSLKNITGSHTFSSLVKIYTMNQIKDPIFSAQDSHGIMHFKKNLQWKAKVQFLNSTIGWLQINSSQVFKSTSAWYLLCYTVDIESQMFKIYIDGQLKFQTNLPIKSIIPSSKMFYLGYMFQNDIAVSFISIDEVKFFDKVLDYNQINQQYLSRPFQRNNLELNLGEISQIILLKHNQFIFCRDKNGKIWKIQIDQKGKFLSSNYFSKRNNLESLTLLRDFDQYILITIENTGHIRQYNIPNQTQTHQQKAQISTQGHFLLSPVYLTRKFVVAELESKIIEIWGVQFRENCHQTCQTCFHPNNLYMCNTCHQNYAQFNASQQTIGFQCRYQCGKSFNKIQGQCVPRSQQVYIASKTLSTFLSIPNLKIVFKFAYSIFAFLEDLWFYKFHNKQYSSFIQQILEQVQKINKQKIFPQQLKFQALELIISENSKFFQTNYKKYTFKSIVKNGVISTSFLANATQIIVYGMINISCLLCILLIVSIIFNYIESKSQTFINIKQKIKENVGIVLFVGGFFQTNLLGIVFFAFQQLKTPFAFNFLEKLNILSAVSFLFLFLVYSLCFFLLVYKFVCKQRSQKVLKYTIWNADSFIQATYILSFKQFFRGFIHGYLIGENITQTVLLILSSLVEIFFVIHFRKSFSYCPYLVFYLVYCVSFLSLNINFLLLQTTDPSQLSLVMSSTQFIQMIIIGVMFSDMIVLVLYSLIVPIYQFLKKKGIICNNKVQAQSKTNQNQKNTFNVDYFCDKGDISTKQAKYIYNENRQLPNIQTKGVVSLIKTNSYKQKTRQIQIVLNEKDKHFLEAINQPSQQKNLSFIQSLQKKKFQPRIAAQNRQKIRKNNIKKSPSKRLAQLKDSKGKSEKLNLLIINKTYNQ